MEPCCDSSFPCFLPSKVKSDPFHDFLAAVASFSSSVSLGETFCLDSPFSSQQIHGALISLGWQCQSFHGWSRNEKVILGPSQWRFPSLLALGFMLIPILVISSCFSKKPKSLPVCSKTFPHPSSALCFHAPAWREVHHLFQRKLQQRRSFRAVFLTSEPCLFLYLFFPSNQGTFAKMCFPHVPY